MRLPTLMLAVAATMLTSTVYANACKGLDQTGCEAASCSWVNGYERRDGREVSGYCRNKPAPKVTDDPLAKLTQPE